MEWYSEKVMNEYNIINKVVGDMLKDKYPNLAYFEIGKETFNELFNPEIETYLPKLDITMCVDFSVMSDSNIGVLAIKYLSNIFGMVVTESNIVSGLGIYTKNFNLNKSQHCKGIVPYTVE